MKPFSYVISVRYGTGCYRHIQINSDSSLATLADAILDSFDFDNDHLSSFYMNNKLYSDQDEYVYGGFFGCNPPMEGKDACDYDLDQLGLEKGKQFIYLFDYGDKWVFKCKVLRVVDDTIPSRWKIIKSVGKSPEQYPVWEE